jgi:hypothetical protein
MNLPLQMRAVARAPFGKARILSSAGRVLPSFEQLCTGLGEYVCSCSEGSICCPAAAGDPCTCNANNYPTCQAFWGPGHHHDDATIECHDGGQKVDCHS